MRLLASVLLLMAMPLFAETPVAQVLPFSLSYTVFRNDQALGVADLRNMQVSPGHWQFVSQTKATQGIANFAGASISEQSNLIVRRERLELLSNRLETKVAWKSIIKTSQLVDAGKTYLYKDDKGSKSVPYQAGMLDQHSLTLALMLDLRTSNKGQNLVYPVFNKGKAEPYTFKVIGYQVLNTALGPLNTVRVDRIRKTANGKTTRSWFAVDKNFIPVLIQQNDENGDDIEMRLIAIR